MPLLIYFWCASSLNQFLDTPFVTGWVRYDNGDINYNYESSSQNIPYCQRLEGNKVIIGDNVPSIYSQKGS